jgi:hypothetical protein
MRALIIASASHDTVISPCSPGDEFLYEIFAALERGRFRRARRLLHYLVEQAAGSRGFLYPDLFHRLCFRHWVPPASASRFRSPRQASAASPCSKPPRAAGVELVVGLQRAAQIGQLRTQIQQVAQRLHLFRYVRGLEIFQLLELQIHLSCPRWDRGKACFPQRTAASDSSAAGHRRSCQD